MLGLDPRIHRSAGLVIGMDARGKPGHDVPLLSFAGLTRESKAMVCRVKPGNDGGAAAARMPSPPAIHFRRPDASVPSPSANSFPFAPGASILSPSGASFLSPSGWTRGSGTIESSSSGFSHILIRLERSSDGTGDNCGLCRASVIQPA